MVDGGGIILSRKKTGKHFLWNGAYREHGRKGGKFGEKGWEWGEQTREA